MNCGWENISESRTQNTIYEIAKLKSDDSELNIMNVFLVEIESIKRRI